MTVREPQIPTDREPVGTRPWRIFFQAIAARAPRSGAVSFGGTASVSVTLEPALPDDRYNVLLDVPENRVVWVSAKSAAGFTLTTGDATSATVGYTIARR